MSEDTLKLAQAVMESHHRGITRQLAQEYIDLHERMGRIENEAWKLRDLYGSSVYDGPAACERILALTKGKSE